MTHQTDIPVALLFPGQGSQSPGMGKALAETEPSAMELWEKAEAFSGLPLRSIYWESNDEELMAGTRALQPAITVVNLNLWLHMAPRLRPVCTAGHSLGEFSALAAAGVLSVDDILALVAERGRLMAEADPDRVGVMAAVLRLTFEEIDEAAKEVCERTGKLVRVANRNTPGQFAISGHREAVEDLVEHLKPNKAKVIPLAVSGAFHTPLMAEACNELCKLLDKLTWNDPAFPVYSNVSGEAVSSGERLHSLMRRQMTSSVLWIDVVGNQWQDGARHWVELGPKGVLTRMVRPILSARGVADNAYETHYVQDVAGAAAYFEGAPSA